MSRQKENDWFLNNLSNQHMDVEAFEEVGLNANNTSLEDEETYKKIDAIKNDPLFQTNGVFNEDKFHKYYEALVASFNELAKDTQLHDLAKSEIFYKDNLFAPMQKRNFDAETDIVKTINPFKELRGTQYLNSVTASPFSLAEIALQNRVLLNPEEVDFEHGDFSNAKWGDTVNEMTFENSFVKWAGNLLNTLVLATWDEDGEHFDPSINQTVKHKKGQAKTDLDGNFFYENLNGRDIYGKLVLSKWDTLTIDGSRINSFDFFDSDDKQKSIGGTLMREAVEIVPMFTPVGAVYVGARVLLQTGNLMSTLGKMIGDNLDVDTSWLSSFQGFNASLSLSRSEYAQSHPWAVENIINMAGDVVGLLAEQRYLFKYLPAIFKGKDALNEEKMLEKQSEWAAEYWKLELGKAQAKGGISATNMAELQQLAQQFASNRSKDYIKDFQELGEQLSKVYMTGITVADAYGEAKEAGASDFEAAALTLGYAVGEWGILSTDIGKWILPEMKAEKLNWKVIAKRLMEGREAAKVSDAADKNLKQSWFRKLLNWGNEVAHADYTGVKAGVKGIVSNALGEGVEETSEELLYDAVKSIGNLGHWIAGDSSVDYEPFKDWFLRYSQSFVGGTLGGAIAQVNPDYYRQLKSYGNLTYDSAMLQLVHIIGEGKEADFLKVVDKMPIDSRFLSPSTITTEDGTIFHKPADDKTNLDALSKAMVHKTVDMFKSILDLHNATISDDSLLKETTRALRDIRILGLLRSTDISGEHFGSAADFLQGFNTARTNLIAAEVNLRNLTSPGPDTYTEDSERQSWMTGAGAGKIAAAKKAVAEADLEVQSYINGEKTPGFVEMLVKELSPEYIAPYMGNVKINGSKVGVINEITFVEAKTGKSYSEATKTKEDKEKWHNEWQKYKDSATFKDLLKTATEISRAIGIKWAPVLTQIESQYFKTKDLNFISALEEFGYNRSRVLQTLAEDRSGDYIARFLETANALFNKGEFSSNISTDISPEMSILTLLALEDPDLKNKILEMLKTEEVDGSEVFVDDDETITANIKNLFAEAIQTNMHKLIDPIIKLGYVHPELRSIVTKVLLETHQSLIYDLPTEGLNEILRMQATVEALPSTPILLIADLFLLSITNPSLKISELVKQSEEIFQGPTLESVALTDEVLQAIDVADQVIAMFESQLLGASVDAIDIHNPHGVNASINAVELLLNVPTEKRSNLAEIDSKTAYRMIQDLAPIRAKLNFLKALTLINTSSKLLELNRTASRIQSIFYNRFKTRLLGHDDKDSVFDESWNVAKDALGKGALDRLKEAFASLSDLKNIYENPGKTLNLAQRKSLEKERARMEDAIYNFFEENRKVDPEKDLSELFKKLDFLDAEEGLLTSKSEDKDISDASFAYWLMSRALLKTSTFLKEYRKAMMANPKIAPIAALELGVLLAYATVLNGDEASRWIKTLQLVIGKTNGSITDTSEMERRWKGRNRASHKLPFDSVNVPLFLNTILIEGVPGSGKSTGVASTVISMLLTNHKSALNNVWVANTSKDRAKTFADDVGLKSNTTFWDRQSLLEKISEYDVSAQKLKAGSKNIIEYSNLIKDANGIYLLPTKLKKLNDSEIPSLIIIDEVGRYSTMEMLLIDKFAQENGITVITLGDLDQTKTLAEAKVPEVDTYVAGLYRGLFAHTPKLGATMRADNSFKKKDLEEIQVLLSELTAVIKSIKQGDPAPLRGSLLPSRPNGLELHYFLDATGLYGNKIIYEPFDPDLESGKNLLETIDVMIKSLDKKEDGTYEKIGYQYYDEDSAIVKYLKEAKDAEGNSKYEPYIEFLPLNTSQGMEAKYYIMEPNTDESEAEVFLLDFYTGITRAKRGTLIVFNDQSKVDDLFGVGSELKDYFILNMEEHYKLETTLPEAAIKQAIDERGQIIDEALDQNSNEVSKFIPRKNAKNVVVVTTNEGTNELPLVEGEDGPELPIILPQTPLSDDLGGFTALNISAREATRLFLYSFNSYETGWTWDKDTESYIPTSNSEYRIDGFNGLSKLENNSTEVTSELHKHWMTVLTSLRNAAYYGTSYDEVMKSIRSISEFKDAEDVIFAYKKGVTFTQEGRRYNDPYFTLDKSERTLNLHLDNARGEEVRGAKLVMLIKQGGKLVLEVPLLTLPNYKTLLKAKDFAGLAAIYEDVKKKYSKDQTIREKFAEALEEVMDPANTEKYIPGALTMHSILTLWNSFQNDMVYLNTDEVMGRDWVFGKDFKATGVVINAKDKGNDYDVDGFETQELPEGTKKKEDWFVPVEQFREDTDKVVSPVSVTFTGAVTVGSTLVNFAKSGTPFVLVTDQMSYDPKSLGGAYIDQIAGLIDYIEKHPEEFKSYDFILNGKLQGGVIDLTKIKVLDIPSLFKRIHLILVVSPTVDSEEWFTNEMHKIESFDRKDDPNKSEIKPIGLNFDLFRVLAGKHVKETIRKILFDQSNVELKQKEFDAAYKIIDELVAIDDKIQELIKDGRNILPADDLAKIKKYQDQITEILRSKHLAIIDFYGDSAANLPDSWATLQFLRRFLVELFSTFRKGQGRQIKKKDGFFKRLTESMKNDGHLRFHINPLYKALDRSSTIVPILNQEGYTIQGKLDSTILYGDGAGLMSKIAEKVTNSGKPTVIVDTSTHQEVEYTEDTFGNLSSKKGNMVDIMSEDARDYRNRTGTRIHDRKDTALEHLIEKTKALLPSVPSEILALFAAALQLKGILEPNEQNIIDICNELEAQYLKIGDNVFIGKPGNKARIPSDSQIILEEGTSFPRKITVNLQNVQLTDGSIVTCTYSGNYDPTSNTLELTGTVKKHRTVKKPVQIGGINPLTDEVKKNLILKSLRGDLLLINALKSVMQVYNKEKDANLISARFKVRGKDLKPEIQTLFDIIGIDEDFNELQDPKKLETFSSDTVIKALNTIKLLEAVNNAYKNVYNALGNFILTKTNDYTIDMLASDPTATPEITTEQEVDEEYTENCRTLTL